ncbi:MAG: PP2C family protein-serine/threonine phosphatase [Acidobacteriota bacterium]
MARPSIDSPRRILIGAVAGGMAVFLLGWLGARRVLPEWRTARLPEPAVAESRFTELLQVSGLPARPDSRPRAVLGSDAKVLAAAYANLGSQAAEWLAQSGCALPIQISQHSAPQPVGSLPSVLTFQICGDLRPWQAQIMPENWFQSAGRPYFDSPVREIVRRVIASGGTGVEPPLGKPQTMMVANSEAQVFALPRGPAGEPQEFLQVVGFPGPGAAATRLPGTLDEATRRNQMFSWSGLFLRTFPGFLLVVGVGALFVALLIKRHLDFVNALWLGLIALVATSGALGEASSSGGVLSAAGLGVVWFGRAFALFVLWSAAESWLRSTLPGFTTSLDAVRAGRLGPRAGRAILGGWGMGAGLAGVQLLVFTFAALGNLVHPTDSSVSVSVFAGSSPLYQAPMRAGLVVLAIAASRRLLPLRWAVPAAIVLTGLVLEMPGLDPWPAALAVSLLTGAVLIWTHQLFGLTALLVAALNTLCLPTAVFAAGQLGWMRGGLILCASLSLALAVTGAVALALREDPNSERVGVPRFVRRLEDERRMRYEMDLLARMQLGLLPETLPEIPGWTIAARSVLANEVGGDLYDFVWDEHGRLWIAAGDVSGHGFSCAITQAMTKAALVSLVYSGTTPSEVLGEIDRVLRTAGDVRNFASLVLLRLDPVTGEGVMANAGHPYALVRGASGVRELALPGLPLGRGPARTYQDAPVALAPGEALVLASDGLFEALAGDDEVYGYDRARTVLQSGAGNGALDVLETLFADWTRFRGGRPASDDTTLVVLRRG